MKFEQLLQIYWSRGFLYGASSHKFDVNLNYLINNCGGLARKSEKVFIKRFELGLFKQDWQLTFTLFKLDFRKVINMYLSQLTSINNNIFELKRYNIIRLYLIRSFRGKAQALGKPSRGQRTWSNAATAYTYNKTLRLFIAEVKKNNVIKKEPTVINFKKLKKKIKKAPVKIKMQIETKKTDFWF